MLAGWNRTGNLSEKPASNMTLKEARSEVIKLRMRVIILQREIERGRPVTQTEQLANLEAGLGMVPGTLAAAVSGERLGADVEAVWDANIEKLYEA